MIDLILFLTSELLFIISFLQIKKSETTLPFVQWLGIALVSVMAVNAVIGGIFGLVGVPISCITIGITLLCISCFLFYQTKRNGSQSYSFSKFDIVFIIVEILVVLAFWIGYFHLKLPIRYVSVDASVHCRWARQLATTHKIDSNLYFGYLNDGLMMEALFPLTGEDGFYHTFALMRLFDFFLVGLLFYGIVCNIPQNRYQKAMTIFLTAIYVCGYPLYAILFGFVYFGDAVTVIAYLIILLMYYREKSIDYKQLLVLINLGLFSLFTTYTLFVPSIFVGVFIYILQLSKKKNGKLICVDNILEQCKVFVFPCVLGMLYAYVNLKEASSGGGISNEGGKYFDLFGNFVILMPFVLSSLYKKLKGKEPSIVFDLFITVSVFTLLLFLGTYLGKVSTYYLSKMYNIIWLLCFVMLVEETVFISKTNKVFLNGCGIVFLVLALFVAVDADSEFLERGYSRVASENYLDIYSFNKEFLFGTPIVEDGMISFYETAEALVVNDKEDVMLYIGKEIPANWYKTFTMQSEIETSDDVEIVIKRIQDGEYKYLCIQNYRLDDNKEMYDNFGNVIYSDEYGEIIQIRD